MNIGIDMAGTLVDTHERFVNYFNSELLGRGFPKVPSSVQGILKSGFLEVDSLSEKSYIHDLYSWVVDLLKGEEKEVIQRFFNTVFGEARLYEGAYESLRKISESHNIFIITSLWLDQFVLGLATIKAIWIQVNLPFINERNLIFSHDKSMIKVDMMVDDFPEHLNGHSFRVLFDQPWNRLFQQDFVVMKDWGSFDSIIAGLV